MIFSQISADALSIFDNFLKLFKFDV